MSKLTRDGTVEPVSRDQILRHARGQGNVHFPCSADHGQDWQPYPVDPYFAICHDRTYIHTSSVRASIFPAKRIQPFFSLVDCKTEFYVLTISLFSTCWAYIYIYIFSEEESQLPGFELTSPRVRRLRGYQLNYRGDRY